MADYDFTSIVRDIAARENIHNPKLELQFSSGKADGFTGTVRAVTIRGSNKKLDVVFKYSPRNAEAHEKMPSLRNLYVNEIKFYEEIAPAFTQFQADHNITRPFDNFPGYYGGVSKVREECLAMENIKCRNYELWDRTKLMNPAHLELALKTFAKFHGTSMAIKKLNPKLYVKITTGLESNLFATFIQTSNYYQQICDVVASLNNIFNSTTEKVYADKMEHYRTHIKEITDPILFYHDEYDVVLQGDCWSNNAMYQYEDLQDRSVPKNINILDWQVIFTGPVTLDLCTFFYTIAPKESFDNLEHYMKVYYDALLDHLKSFGLNIYDVYPYKVFEDHWRKGSLFGLLQTFSIRKMMFMKSEDAPDLADDVDNFVSNIRIADGYINFFKQQMKEIITHFVDRKFL